MVTTAKYVIPRMLGAFCEKFPEIDVDMALLNRDQVLERLKDDMDELYVMSMPPEDSSLEIVPFLENPLVVVAPANYLTAQTAPLSLRELATERFIMREEGSGTRMAVNHYLAQQNLSLSVRLTLGSNEAIKQAVAGGMGFSILSRHVLGHAPAEDGLKELNVMDFPLEREWYVLHRRARPLSIVDKTFLEYLLGKKPASCEGNPNETRPDAGI